MKIKIEISEELMGARLDQVVAASLEGLTRGEVARAIREGMILVSDIRKKPGYRVKPGEIIFGEIESKIEPEPFAESIPLDVLYEDQWVIVVNKPAGIVVHPAPGNSCGTLVNALLHHSPALGIHSPSAPPRAGIVHRLDKDTSGVMVAAKSRQAFDFLQKEFTQRRVQKQYLALVTGSVEELSGRIILPIGRHPIRRKIMAINTERARYAETLWRVVKKMDGYTFMDVELKTGRTHQIRVHFRALGYPILGDKVYGFRKKRGLVVPRQMLHARNLSFRHPWSGKRVDFSAPVPGDMVNVLELLNSGSPLEIQALFGPQPVCFPCLS